MEMIRERTSPLSHNVRLYRMHCLLCFLIGLLIGCAIAYAEHAEWLPRVFSDRLHVQPFGMAMLGACLTQTAALPLLFILGLRSVSYFYTSRALCLCFWFGRGVDLINICIAVNSIVYAIPFFALLILISMLMLRAVTFAAHGASASPFAYCYHALRLWGALLITQFVFHLFLMWIVK